jgi:hypothetical protein
MSMRNAAWLAWSVWGLTIVLVALRLVLQYLNDPASFLGNLFKVLSLAFATVGALVASRRPQNPIGWILEAGALLLALSDFAEQYAVYTLVTEPGALWGGWFMGWIRLWASTLGFYLIFTFTFLLFPSGRLLSRRWLPVMWFAVGVAGLLTVTAALQPGSFSFIPSLQNPYGIDAKAGVLSQVNGIVNSLVRASVGSSALSVILRFRRAQGEERQQFKWIAYAAALLILYAIVGVFVETLSPQYALALESAEAPVFVALPVAVGIAILKYRLYDIDLIIRRTLIYGILTAALALVYFGSVAVLQALFSAVTGQQQSPLVIVLSTLAIAALFAPLRRHVQNAIDHRFYRRKYDAEKTIANFSAFLRDEVDLDRLETALLSVIEETFQPESLSLWRRESSHLGKGIQIERY